MNSADPSKIDPASRFQYVSVKLRDNQPAHVPSSPSAQVLKAISDAIGQDRTAIRYSPFSMGHGMRMPLPDLKAQFTHIIKSIRDQFPRLAYLHMVEPRIQGINDMELQHPDDSLDFAREVWGEREGSPFIAAGGYGLDRLKAIETVERWGGALTYGRLFIANPDLPVSLVLPLRL